MSRVKFNVNTEYAYLQNFKILQSTHHTLAYNETLSAHDSRRFHETRHRTPSASRVVGKMQNAG